MIYILIALIITTIYLLYMIHQLKKASIGLLELTETLLDITDGYAEVLGTLETDYLIRLEELAKKSAKKKKAPAKKKENN
jgi:hypothetical protein